MAGLLHLLILMTMPRRDTDAARRMPLLLLVFFTVLLCNIIPISSRPSYFNNDYATLSPLWLLSVARGTGSGHLFLLGIMIAGWFACFHAYSLPSNYVSAIPLMIHYALLFLIVTSEATYLLPLLLAGFLPMAGYRFPRHRRLSEYWRPSRLPKIRARSSGVTLIELLIAIAVLSIFAVAVGFMSGVAHTSMERQETWRQAIQLAEEEIALLRARESLPALGRHPVEPELAGVYEFAGQAEVEILPGPAPGLREARVHVHLLEQTNRRDMTMAAILPVRPPGERSP